MSQENIDIKISEDGSRLVVVNINRVANAADKAHDSLGFLKNVLSTIIAGLGINQIAKYADAWSAASGQIRIATNSLAEANAVQDEVFKSAQKTRTEFTSMVDLYTRAERASDDLGASQKDIIKFTEGVGKALAIQNTSSAQASGALLQLGQALGGAKIQAQEFNSLIDGAPVILQTVARGMDGVDGSIGELTRRVKSGQVTNKEFFDAFLKGSDQLDKDFNKASITIGQGLTIIENGLIKYIGKLDQSLGLSAKFGNASKFIADNIDLIASFAIAAGVAIAVAFAPNVLTAFYVQLKAVLLLLNANPFGVVIAAIAGVITLLTLYGNQLDAGIDKTTTMKDVLVALGQIGYEVWTDLLDVAETVWSLITDFAITSYSTITGITESETLAWANQFKDFYADLEPGFAGVLKGIARTFDAIGGLVTGIIMFTVRSFKSLPDLIKGNLNFADVWKTALEDGFAQQGGYLEKGVDSLIERAQEQSRKRLASATIDAPVDLNVRPDFKNKGPTDEEIKAVEKLTRSLNSLLGTIAPVDGALLDMALAEKTLSDSVAKGLITTEEQTRYLESLKVHYQDIIDPIGKINREIDEQTHLLGLNAEQRQIEAQMLSITKELLSQSIVLNEEETNAIRSKLTALQDYNRLVEEQDNLLAQSVERRNQFAIQLQAIQNLLNDPDSGFTQFDATEALMQQNATLFEGTQEAVNAQLESYKQMYLQIDQMRQADLISTQTAEQMKTKVAVQENQLKTQNIQSFFGNIATLSRSENKKLAAIGKAAAIAQATIDGVLAVQKALASAPPPVNYALAAAVGVATAANVAQIAGVGFMTGGEFTVGGSGGADSKLVAFRGTPGEKVQVSTPTQVRKGDTLNGNKQPQEAEGMSVTIINIDDHSKLEEILTGARGSRIFINQLNSHTDEVKSIANA